MVASLNSRLESKKEKKKKRIRVYRAPSDGRDGRFELFDALYQLSTHLFPEGLVFKAHRFMCHSTLSSRVIKQKKAPFDGVVTCQYCRQEGEDVGTGVPRS
jgi:hypothetical protein